MDIYHATHRYQSRTLIPAIRTVFETLNGPYHRRAVQIFTITLLAHFADHLVQAYQVHVLQVPESLSHGFVALILSCHMAPGTIDWLHHGFAFFMLGGIAVLTWGFTRQARRWWNIALAIQLWHFFEHSLLAMQVVLNHNLFGFSEPVSILQLVVPRVELHLFYTTLAMVPMGLATLYEFAEPLTRPSGVR